MDDKQTVVVLTNLADSDPSRVADNVAEVYLRAAAMNGANEVH